MKFTTALQKFYDNLWYFYLFVSKEKAAPFIKGDHRRVVVTLNGQHRFHAALMPDGKGDYFINVNKEIRKKLGLNQGVDVEVELEKDTSKYGMEMPEELGELLGMDDEGSDYFHALTPGKQRTLIYQVAKPKTSDTRLKKALVIVEFLKRHKGNLDFKALAEAYKDANER